jgi:hypothetical protein
MLLWLTRQLPSDHVVQSRCIRSQPSAYYVVASSSHACVIVPHPYAWRVAIVKFVRECIIVQMAQYVHVWLGDLAIVPIMTIFFILLISKNIYEAKIGWWFRRVIEKCGGWGSGNWNLRWIRGTNLQHANGRISIRNHVISPTIVKVDSYWNRVWCNCADRHRSDHTSVLIWRTVRQSI